MTDGVIHVTSEGVAIPASSKYDMTSSYVGNPKRRGRFGEVSNGKFKERSRIVPATPAGKLGPNYSHYHLDGTGQHYNPRSSDRDPGF